MKLRNIFLVSTAILGIAGIANAVPTLYVSTTGAAGSWTAVANNASGAVAWNGAAGVWTINITSGVTYDAVGSAYLPTMDLAIQGSSSAAGQLWIAFAANDFEDVGGSVSATLTGQAVTGSESYQFWTYSDASDNQPTTTLPPTGSSQMTYLSGSLDGGANVSTNGSLPNVAPNTLMEIVDVTAAGASTASVDADFTEVKDGGATAILLGVGLCGLALFKRKSAGRKLAN